MESTNFLQYISQGIFYLIEAIIIIACIMLVFKQRSIATILMLAGSILALFFSLSRTIMFAIPSFSDDFENMMVINNSISLLQGLSYALFGIGFFIFALNYIKSIGNASS